MARRVHKSDRLWCGKIGSLCNGTLCGDCHLFGEGVMPSESVLKVKLTSRDINRWEEILEIERERSILRDPGFTSGIESSEGLPSGVLMGTGNGPNPFGDPDIGPKDRLKRPKRK